MTETVAQEKRRLRKEVAQLEKELESVSGLAALEYFAKLAARSRDKEMQAAFADLIAFTKGMAAKQRDTSAARKASAERRRARTDAEIQAVKPKARSKKELAGLLNKTRQALLQAEKRRG